MGKNLREEARYADKHDSLSIVSEITIDQWFDYWIENIFGDHALNMRRNYGKRYIHSIQPYIALVFRNRHAFPLLPAVRPDPADGIAPGRVDCPDVGRNRLREAHADRQHDIGISPQVCSCDRPFHGKRHSVVQKRRQWCIINGSKSLDIGPKPLK